MGTFIFFLSFPIAIAVWVWIVKKLKASGTKGFVRHLIGFLVSSVVFFVIAGSGGAMEVAEQKKATGSTPPVTQTDTTQTEKEAASQVTVTSSPVQISVEQENEPIAEPVKTLDLNWSTFRRRANEDLKSVSFSPTIPASIKPEGSENSVRDTAMLPFNDNLLATIAVDPDSGRLTSISVMASSSSDGAANIKNFSAAALLLATADGDNGNKTVGGQLIRMISNALESFNKGDKEEVKESFVVNGVKYGIIINRVLPAAMMYAEPDE